MTSDDVKSIDSTHSCFVLLKIKPADLFIDVSTPCSVDDVVEEAYERLGYQNVTGYHLKSARKSLNILLQEWGNRGLHYWEVDETNVDLVQGQSDYDFFRSSSDGSSATTAPTNNIYGLSDILEAQLRSNRTQTTRPNTCLLYTSPSPRDRTRSRMPSSA